MRLATISSSLATPSSGSWQRTRWKSLPGSWPGSGIRPWLMRCALVMIRLCAACRNTSVSRTTGTAALAMMSASTWPGPTDGS